MKKIRYVTPLQKMICDLIYDNPLHPVTIANELKRKVNVIVIILRKLEKLDYIKKHKQCYVATGFEFVECERNVLVSFRNKVTEMESYKEIQVYKPTEEVINSVRILHNAGFKRKEIAKKLNMTVPEILWTFFTMNIEDDVQFEENIIVLEEPLYTIYQMLRIPNMNLSNIAKKTNLTIEQVVRHIMKLEEVGAAVVKVHSTHTEYFAKEMDVQKLEEKNDEIKVKKDDCKRNCTCQSDKRKCGV